MAQNSRINEQIRISPVRLIDQDGEQRGIMPTSEAMNLAQDAGLDLVEVSSTERPPVCRIMDYGKWKYDQKKKRQKAQGGHEIHIKEVRIRPKTDDNDRRIKIKRALDFLTRGDKVQFTMLFRGRERFHREIGFDAFRQIEEELGEIAKVERPAKMEGRRMTMVMVPLKH